jgi:hypothetical protein
MSIKKGYPLPEKKPKQKTFNFSDNCQTSLIASLSHKLHVEHRFTTKEYYQEAGGTLEHEKKPRNTLGFLSLP